ncbi:MAG: tRNA pseudouridine(55) synthase TruB [Pseudomonadota bacterium]
MARRRKGRRIDGWLVLDKPVGPSSAHGVAKARRALEAQKAGHAGTLDPLASGVLAIAFGEATKTVPVAQEGAKAYRFTVRLGQATETDDAEGGVIAESPARPTDAEIAAALTAFEGEIMQVPPAYSAIKVDGERAYAVARAGDSVTLAARPLTVHAIALIARPDADHAVVEMTCGKGGYVRSVARDLGVALGCHGHVADLRRTAAGPFALAQAVPWEALEDPAALEAALLPLEAGLTGLPMIPVTPGGAADLRRGAATAATAPPPPNRAEGWAALGGQAVALVRIEGGVLHPNRVFAAPEG